VDAAQVLQKSCFLRDKKIRLCEAKNRKDLNSIVYRHFLISQNLLIRDNSLIQSQMPNIIIDTSLLVV